MLRRFCLPSGKETSEKYRPADVLPAQSAARDRCATAELPSKVDEADLSRNLLALVIGSARRACFNVLAT